ncbi:MAG: TAXI family TRAP transporter solute-binding subunit [Enhydrobacter sp.]|nr:TAXI family TRAP transporter solute-binding subunit [Enhydrobacter sp.]
MRRRTLLSALPAISVAPALARSPMIRMGTAVEGSGFYPYSVALIDALKVVDPTLEIEAVRTKGSTENAEGLLSGDFDMGLVGGEALHEWVSGHGNERPLKIVSAVQSAPGMFCVRADSRYRSIAELEGRPVVWGPRGAGGAVQARYVMDGMGLDMDRDFQAIYPANFTDGPHMVLESRAAAIWGIGLRWPGFVVIAGRPLGARFIVPSADEIARIRGKYPFLEKLTVPAGLYPGQYDPLHTVGAWSFILARPDLDDEAGYRMAAALNKVERARAFTSQLVQTTARNTLSAIKSIDDLQPGVLRYYRDIKLVK